MSQGECAHHSLSQIPPSVPLDVPPWNPYHGDKNADGVMSIWTWASPGTYLEESLEADLVSKEQHQLFWDLSHYIVIFAIIQVTDLDYDHMYWFSISFCCLDFLRCHEIVCLLLCKQDMAILGSVLSSRRIKLPFPRYWNNNSSLTW